MSARSGGSLLPTLRLALSLVARSGRRPFAVIVASTVVTSLALAGQLLVGRALLNAIVRTERPAPAELAPHLAALAFLLLAAAVSQSTANELRLLVGERVHRGAMDEILDAATEVELEAYEGSDFHDGLQRARQASAGQSTAVAFGLVTLASTALVAAGVVTVLLAVAPILVPIAVAGYLPIAFVNARNNRAYHELELSLTELGRERAYLEYLMTERSEAKEIRAYGVAPTLRAWHRDLWQERLRKLTELLRLRVLRTTIGSAVTTLALTGTVGITVVLAVRGTITVGDAAVAVVGLQQLNSRLQAAGAALGTVHAGVTFLQDFERFRTRVRAARAGGSARRLAVRPSTLVADGVGYRYPGSAVDALVSVSFELRRGQTMAVVGANGSGKSTLAKLVCDLLPPTRGAIRWDGVDISECEAEDVRSHIAPVFQDYAQYMFTLRRAIGLGDTARLHDDDAIAAAAAQAGLDDLISSLPAGLDTRLGTPFTGGVDISVGQWQRLAIARALFRDAAVIVLDEPSASLDPRAEAALFDLLQATCEDRIVIFVAHRLASVRSADVVLVLDHGEVVEMGTHDDLMRASGLYAELFTLQARRYGFAP